MGFKNLKRDKEREREKNRRLLGRPFFALASLLCMTRIFEKELGRLAHRLTVQKRAWADGELIRVVCAERRLGVLALRRNES